MIHYLASPLAPGPAVAEVDAGHRLDLTRQHTAQHLLTAILLDRHGLPTTAFHLGETYTAIEVDGPVPSEDALLGFEAEVNAEIRADRAVRTVWAEVGDLERLRVRSRGLPADHRGAVRLVEIEGVDLNTCGGTHVARLAEIQAVHILDAAPARGGARIRFLAGGRVLAALRDHGRREADLRRLLDSAPEDFARLITAGREERVYLAKRVRTLEAELAARVGADLAGEKAVRIERHLGSAGPEYLRNVANAALALRPEAVLVLTGDDPATGGICFLVRAGPDGPEDVSDVGEQVRARLGAKGGGRGRLFMGAVPRE